MSTARTSLFLAGLGLSPLLPAQGAYTALSFEPPTFHLGTLAGDSLFNGQDGWLVTGDGPVQLSSIQVQNHTVRSGTQAGQWDAALFGSGATYAHLRRNAQFNGTGITEVELDLRLDQGSQPSASWGLQVQLLPMPASVQVWWEIRADGSVWYTRGTIGISLTWVATGVVLNRGQWYHTRTVVDATQMDTQLWIDGVPAFRGVPPIATTPLPGHGFTSIVCSGPGNDRLQFDNFTVRDRARTPALALDLTQVPAGQPARISLRLAAGPGLAGLGYVVLGSAAGQSPGLLIAPGVLLPLNLDAFLLTVASNLNSPVFDRFAGTLSPYGTATAELNTGVPLPLALAGRTLHFAYATIPLGQVSEAAALQIR